MVPHLEIAEMLCSARVLRQSSLPASAPPLSQNPLRALSFSFIYYSLRVGEEGRTVPEIRCAAWRLPRPTTVLPQKQVGHGLNWRCFDALHERNQSAF